MLATSHVIRMNDSEETPSSTYSEGLPSTASLIHEGQGIICESQASVHPGGTSGRLMSQMKYLFMLGKCLRFV